MASTEDVCDQLPSPPLSPSNLCKDTITNVENDLNNKEYEFVKNNYKLSSYDEIFFEKFLNSERFIYSNEELMKIQALISCPIQNQHQSSREDILRNKYMNIMKNGIEIKGEMISYSEAIKNLHNNGSSIFNKKTDDAVILHAYESENLIFQKFWVHPLYLSLQSFPFFKLFEEIKEDNIQGIIEIEVSSLKAFNALLYYLYTGSKIEILESLKLDKTYYKGIMEMLIYLEISMKLF